MPIEPCDDTVDPDGLGAQYQAIRPQYEAFTTSLESLVRTLIDTSGIDIFSVEPRTKTLESFNEKIIREDKTGRYKCTQDITDLSGVRIISFLQDDCNAVCKMLEENLIIDKDNSVIKEDQLDPDKFGYLSTHYIVSLGDDRTNLIEFARFKGMKAEIQVRTLLQHTWAAIDWKFRYKEQAEAPKELRRRLFRISALLEAADNEFSAVNDAITRIREKYADDISRGELQITLNTESVRSFISTNETAKRLIKIALDAGVTVSPAEEGDLPYQRLVSIAQALNLSNLQHLETYLDKYTASAPAFYQALVDYRLSSPITARIPQLFPVAMIRFLLMGCASKEKRKQLFSKHTLPLDYDEAIEASANKLKQNTSK